MALASPSLAASSESLQKSSAKSPRFALAARRQLTVPTGDYPSSGLFDLDDFKSISPFRPVRQDNMSQAVEPGNPLLPYRASESSAWEGSDGTNEAPIAAPRVTMAPFVAPDTLSAEYDTGSEHRPGLPVSYSHDGTYCPAPMPSGGQATSPSSPPCGAAWPSPRTPISSSVSHTSLDYEEHMASSGSNLGGSDAYGSSPQVPGFSARGHYPRYSAGGPIFFTGAHPGSLDGSLRRWGEQKRAAASLHPSPSRNEPSSPPSAGKTAGQARSRQSTRKHTTREEANFQCNVQGCGKLFSRSYNFKSHMEIHDKKRAYPFPCAISGCVKKFVRKTDLQRHHQSVHVRERNHQCDYCGRLFARKDTSRRHMEDGCSKRFDIETLDLRTDDHSTADLVDLPTRAGLSRIALGQGSLVSTSFTVGGPIDTRGNRVGFANRKGDALGPACDG